MVVRLATARSARAAAVVVLVAALGACGESGDTQSASADTEAHADHDTEESGAEEGDEHADHSAEEHEEYLLPLPEEFEAALEEVTTERAHEIIADGVVTMAEVEDLRVIQAECLVEAGYDAEVVDGSLQLREVPDGTEEASVTDDVEGCLGDIPVVAALAGS